MAIDAFCRLLIAARYCLGVEAAIVGLLLIRVTTGTLWLHRRRIVRAGTLYVLVAVRTLEHAPVNGSLERLLVDRVVARQAIGAFQFSGRRSHGRADPKE